MSLSKWHITGLVLVAWSAASPAMASETNPWAMPHPNVQGYTGQTPYVPAPRQNAPVRPVQPPVQNYRPQPYQSPNRGYGNYAPLPEGKSPSVLEQPQSKQNRTARPPAAYPYYAPYALAPGYGGYWGGGYGLGYGLGLQPGLTYAPPFGLWGAPYYGYGGLPLYGYPGGPVK